MSINNIHIARQKLGFIAIALLLYNSPTLSNVIDAVNPALLEKKLDAIEPVPKSESLSIKKIIPKEKISEAVAKIKIHVKKIVFIKGEVYSKAKLQKLAVPYLGYDIPLGNLFQLAEEITRIYRNDGYLLSRAIVPPQTIKKNGEAQIQIIEGYVANISYEGEVNQISEKAKSLAAKIKESRPLKSSDLERYLLLMRDLPGLHIEAVLKPSEVHTQAVDLVIIAKRKKFSSAVSINNEGSKYIGPYMANVIIATNALLGREDQFILQGVTTQKTRQLQHGHAIYNKFVGTEGTKLTIEGSYTKTRPDNSLKFLNIKGKAKSLNSGLQHPFLRSRSKNIYGGLHFAMRNVNSSLLNNAIINKDKLRIISSDLIWDNADHLRGMNLVHFKISRGLTSFGSTKNSDTNKSRSTGRPDFTKLNLVFSRLQSLKGNFSLYGIVEGQYAFNPLLSPERFTYGSSAHFKAYTNAPLSGDSGVKEKIELIYGKSSSADFLRFYQIYGFWGYGTTWNKKITADEHKRMSAPEIGVGIRLRLPGDTSLNLEYDRPLRKQIGLNRNAATIFLNVTKML